MNTNYTNDVTKVVTALGGITNIQLARICATRIKILPVDISKVNFLSLEKEKWEIIQGTFEINGYVHLIIGTGKVYHFRDEMIKIGITFDNRISTLSSFTEQTQAPSVLSPDELKILAKLLIYFLK